MKKSKETFTPRKIDVQVPPSMILSDLEDYRRMALDLGAAAADVVFSGEILVDERVRAKCMYPKCAFYGNNINCPPHAPDLDFTRKLIGRYTRGILFCVKGKTEDFTGADFLQRVGMKNPAKSLLNRICTEVESKAFYDGYPFALALGQGPAKASGVRISPARPLSRAGCAGSPSRQGAAWKPWGSGGKRPALP